MPEPGVIQEKPQSLSLQDLLKFLSQAAPKAAAAMPSGGGGGPVMMPGRVGQIGQPFSPTLPNGMRLPGPMGMPTPNLPTPQNMPEMGAYNTGFEFSNKGARDAAVVTNAIQGLSSLVSGYKQKKEQKTRAQAENYMSQIIAAQQSGDTQALNLLLEDPKVIKTLEKGLEYYMPKVPGEKATPESEGIHSAIKKTQQRLAAPNTPGGVSIPRMSETQGAQNEAQRLAALAAMKKLQNDPELAAQQGLGTALSGEEAAKAARIAGGLGLSAAQYAQLEENDRKALQAFDMFKMEQENKLRQQAAEIQGQKDVATIHAGPLHERAQIARELGHAQIKMREQFAKGKGAEAVKTALQTLTSQVNTLRGYAEKAKKDGNDDMAASYTKDADDLQKRYDELQKASQFDIDSIIRDVLGSE